MHFVWQFVEFQNCSAVDCNIILSAYDPPRLPLVSQPGQQLEVVPPWQMGTGCRLAKHRTDFYTLGCKVSCDWLIHFYVYTSKTSEWTD